MNIPLLIIAIFIFLVSANLVMAAGIEYNILKNIGAIKIKLFGLPIFSRSISISGEYLNITRKKPRKKEKVVKIKIDINDESFKFAEDIQANLVKCIYPEKLFINVDLCIPEPFVVSMASAALNLILNIFYSKLKVNHKDMELIKNINTGYRHDMAEVKVTYKFRLSLHDMVWSVLNAIKKSRRRKGNERRQKAQAK